MKATAPTCRVALSTCAAPGLLDARDIVEKVIWASIQYGSNSVKHYTSDSAAGFLVQLLATLHLAAPSTL